MMTAMIGPTGERVMISQGGNSKYPDRFQHPMCGECKKEMIEEMGVALLFNNDQKLIGRWKGLQAKHGK
jgi:hypothetical protein